MRFLRQLTLRSSVVVLLLAALIVPGTALGKGDTYDPVTDPWNERIAVQVAADGSSNIWNERIAVQVAADGSFNMGAFPDPATGGSTAGSWDLMYRWPSGPGTSFTTVRIDGSDYRYGQGGEMVQPPTDIDASTNSSSWRYGDVVVEQILRIVQNPMTGHEDLAQIEYRLSNTGSTGHAVGLRVMIDTEINYNDGAPFRIPGVGAITTEREFFAAEIPSRADVFYSLTDSTHVASAQLRLTSLVPDRFVIARWPGIRGTMWDYAVNTDASITSDSAYAVYWDPTHLAPGETRSVFTHYGLDEFDADLTPPLGLGVSGPASLGIADDEYSPNPFDVVATVINNSSMTVDGVIATLDLSSGLTASDTHTSVNIGTLAAGEERQVSWRVTAANSDTDRLLTYGVTLVGTGAEAKTVTRELMVPGLAPYEPIVFTAPYELDYESMFAVGTANSVARVDKNKGTFSMDSRARARYGVARTAAGCGVRFVPDFTGRVKVRASLTLGPKAFDSVISMPVPMLDGTNISTLKSWAFIRADATEVAQSQFQGIVHTPLDGIPGIPTPSHDRTHYNPPRAFIVDYELLVQENVPVNIFGGIGTEEVVTGLVGWTSISRARYDAQVNYIAITRLP